MFELASYGESTIKLGSKSIDVNTLQTMLKAKGFFDEAITGTFGATTKSAVMNFQRANRLIVDGIVGVNTWAALKGISPAEAVRQEPDIRSIVSGGGLIPEYIDFFGTQIPTLYLGLGIGVLVAAIIYKNMNKPKKGEIK